MTRARVAVELWEPVAVSHKEWAELRASAPQMAATFRRYLIQLTTFHAPRSVEAADQTLRQFTRGLIAATDVRTVVK